MWSPTSFTSLFLRLHTLISGPSTLLGLAVTFPLLYPQLHSQSSRSLWSSLHGGPTRFTWSRVLSGFIHPCEPEKPLSVFMSLSLWGFVFCFEKADLPRSAGPSRRFHLVNSSLDTSPMAMWSFIDLYLNSLGQNLKWLRPISLVEQYRKLRWRRSSNLDNHSSYDAATDLG